MCSNMKLFYVFSHLWVILHGSNRQSSVWSYILLRTPQNWKMCVGQDSSYLGGLTSDHTNVFDPFSYILLEHTISQLFYISFSVFRSSESLIFIFRHAKMPNVLFDLLVVFAQIIFAHCNNILFIYEQCDLF